MCTTLASRSLSCLLWTRHSLLAKSDVFLRRCTVVRPVSLGVAVYGSPTLNKLVTTKATGQQRSPTRQLQQLLSADTLYLTKTVHSNAKTVVNNLYNKLSANLGPSCRYEQVVSVVGRLNHKMVWQCTSRVGWPGPLTTQGYGLTKRKAELAAKCKLLDVLHQEGHLDERGHPVTVSVEERARLREEMNRPPVITIPPELMAEGEHLIDTFYSSIRPWMASERGCDSPVWSSLGEESDDEGAEEAFAYREDASDGGARDVAAQWPREMDERQAERRNKALWTRLHSRPRHAHPPLPMLAYREELERALEQYQVVVVAGDTGCGKSTQVPQMILDQWTREGRGADCNIVVTQPRRISAIALAKRVAAERGEQVGDTVGYSVRLHHRRVRECGGVMFFTAGMLLQTLTHNPALQGVTHVVVDEVHEQSVQTELLLLLLRRLLRAAPHLRVVLMSASLRTDQFQRYFGQDESALIEVPGALFPLTRHYLPEVFGQLGLSPRRYQVDSLMEPTARPFINHDLIADVIKGIHGTRPPGAVLCFLPGWQDIRAVQGRLEDDPGAAGMMVLPLHSRLSPADQELIFNEADEGVRKVVLSTNLAETSLTVQDVVYVVDCGAHKENRYDPERNVSVMSNQWVSRASGQQRAGRAGRVAPGEVFHLYSSLVHRNMAQYPTPEIMRVPLEHVILQCKSLCSDESAVSVLSEGLNSPSENRLSHALDTLQRLGMVEGGPDGVERLTALGRRVVHFSTPPHLSKALVLASILKCVDSVVRVVAALGGGQDIWRSGLDHRPQLRELKCEVHAGSDLLAMLGLTREWEHLRSYADKLNFCNHNFLSHRSLTFNAGIARLFAGHLSDAGLVDNHDVMSPHADVNSHSHTGQLVLGALLGGVGEVLRYRQGVMHKGIFKHGRSVITTESGARVCSSSSSVLHRTSGPDTAHLLAVNVTRDDTASRTVARDLSALHPLTVALFLGDGLAMTGGTLLTVQGNRGVSFTVDHRTGELVVWLRGVLDDLVKHQVATRGVAPPPPPHVQQWMDAVINLVSAMLEGGER